MAAVYRQALAAAAGADPTAPLLRGQWWNHVLLHPPGCPLEQWALDQGLLVRLGGGWALPFYGSYTQVRALMRALLAGAPPGALEGCSEQVGPPPPADWAARTAAHHDRPPQ
ncbi:hypothetical protein [Streptacidiphilus sp. PAMC 29251]